MLSSIASRFTRSSQVSFYHTLVLVRHGQSTWNLENRFTGWHDVDLTELGQEEAKKAGQLLLAGDYQFDSVHTSYLRRAIKTCYHVLEQSNQMHLPITTTWELNERHYGALTGLDKQETLDKHGKELVMKWRRSYDFPPPALDKDSEYYPGNDAKYRHVPEDQLPLTESLSITLDRVLPYWNASIVPQLQEGRRVLVVAHGNSIRSLVKHLDDISEEEITGVNIPTGMPLVYHLDEATLKPVENEDVSSLGVVVPPLRGFYLGDREEVEGKILGVKHQTK